MIFSPSSCTHSRPHESEPLRYMDTGPGLGNTLHAIVPKDICEHKSETEAVPLWKQAFAGTKRFTLLGDFIPFPLCSVGQCRHQRFISGTDTWAK